ncbi:hypothetical protein N9226_00175 [bacterium]|nr:hypothetical protein [bacterium]
MSQARAAATAAALFSLAVLFHGQAPSSDLEARVGQLEGWKSTVENRLNSLEVPPKRELGVGKERSERILAVTVKNKRFDRNGSEDDRPWRNVATIWWDAVYETYELEKDARSVQGILQFCDLFGDPQFECRVTINEPIRVGKTHKAPTGGVDFNPKEKAHEWLLSTRLQNMTFRFRATRVLYMDGTREEFED